MPVWREKDDENLLTFDLITCHFKKTCVKSTFLFNQPNQTANPFDNSTSSQSFNNWICKEKCTEERANHLSTSEKKICHWFQSYQRSQDSEIVSLVC